MPALSSAGMDGCSEPLALLVSSPLSPEGSFVAPSVESLVKQGETQARPLLLQAIRLSRAAPNAA